jgi:hypothetical protein
MSARQSAGARSIQRVDGEVAEVAGIREAVKVQPDVAARERIIAVATSEAAIHEEGVLRTANQYIDPIGSAKAFVNGVCVT